MTVALLLTVIAAFLFLLPHATLRKLRLRSPWFVSDGDLGGTGSSTVHVPALRVEIARFESLQNIDREYFASKIKIIDVVRNGATFMALIVLEAPAESAVAKNWAFNARTKDGSPVRASVVEYGLGPPPRWGADLEPFNAVNGIRIKKGALHRVYVHLGIKPDGVDESWLSASFDDDSGQRRTVELDTSQDMPPALLTGRIKRFEVLDARDLSAAEFMELEENFRHGDGMFYYIALVQITSGNLPSRATNWRFSVRAKDGSIIPFTPVTKHWDAPASWPKIIYCTLDEVENTYLTENRVYNVFLHLQTKQGLASTLDLRSFEARFMDSNNREIVCEMGAT